MASGYWIICWSWIRNFMQYPVVTCVSASFLQDRWKQFILNYKSTEHLKKLETNSRPSQSQVCSSRPLLARLEQVRQSIKFWLIPAAVKLVNFPSLLLTDETMPDLFLAPQSPPFFPDPGIGFLVPVLKLNACIRRQMLAGYLKVLLVPYLYVVPVILYEFLAG